jgi:hypothetical protein
VGDQDNGLLKTAAIQLFGGDDKKAFVLSRLRRLSLAQGRKAEAQQHQAQGKMSGKA